MPNTITNHTSIRSADLAKYLTKLLAASGEKIYRKSFCFLIANYLVLCMLVRFVLPGPVTSFGLFYKLAFIVGLSATALSVVETSGGRKSKTPSYTSRTDSEKSSEEDDSKRRLGKKSLKESYKSN